MCDSCLVPAATGRPFHVAAPVLAQPPPVPVSWSMSSASSTPAGPFRLPPTAVEWMLKSPPITTVTAGTCRRTSRRYSTSRWGSSSWSLYTDITKIAPSWPGIPAMSTAAASSPLPSSPDCLLHSTFSLARMPCATSTAALPDWMTVHCRLVMYSVPPGPISSCSKHTLAPLSTHIFLRRTFPSFLPSPLPAFH